MDSPFDITILSVPTISSYEWFQQLSEFLSEEIKDGAWIRGWPDLHFWLLNAWLETTLAMTLPKGCVERLESTARKIDSDVVEQMLARDLTYLYRVSETDELRAFFLTSWDHCEFPLILFPANVSPDDEALILSTADTLSVKSYPTLSISASWFVTVNVEGVDDSFVCFATKSLERAESFRRSFHNNVFPLDKFIKEYC